MVQMSNRTYPSASSTLMRPHGGVLVTAPHTHLISCACFSCGLSAVQHWGQPHGIVALELWRWDTVREALQLPTGSSCQSWHQCHSLLCIKQTHSMGLLILNEDFWNILIPRISCQDGQDLQSEKGSKLKKLPLPSAVWEKLAVRLN